MSGLIISTWNISKRERRAVIGVSLPVRDTAWIRVWLVLHIFPRGTSGSVRLPSNVLCLFRLFRWRVSRCFNRHSVQPASRCFVLVDLKSSEMAPHVKGK
jgi:hypothetical protein